MERLKKLLLGLLTPVLLCACTASPVSSAPAAASAAPAATVAARSAEPSAASAETLDEAGSYDTKDEVALYLHEYGHLPDNYITKKEARRLGWEGGSLESFAPGKCIGGDVYSNYEKTVPEADGRVYHECDIGTLGKKSRGAKRIIYSNDGLIYYTKDHYESFTLLYDKDGAK
jgi:guanyl-specific ribonuclease Sa